MSNSTEPFPAKADGVSIPENLRELVKNKLKDDETIRWIDQPIVSSNGILLFFLFVFTGSLLGDYLIHAQCGTANMFVQYLPVIVSGCFLIVGLLTFFLWLGTSGIARQTVYVITNFRAIIIRGTSYTVEVISYDPAELLYLTSTQKANAVEHLFLRAGLFGRGSNKLLRLRNVREVERLIRELKGTR